MTTAPVVPAGNRSCRAMLGVMLPSDRPKPALASSCAVCVRDVAPVSASRSSSSTVMVRLFSCLSRITLIGTVVAGLVPATILISSSRLATGLPLNSMMTSPGSMPAFAAGVSFPTDTTAAPDRDFRPRSDTNSLGTSLTVTPIRPRTTFPARSCGSSSRTRLIGMANPIPMFPSLWLFEMMAVLMPMTSPRMFNSGPPELPGLMAASVCSTSCDRCSATVKGRLVALMTPTVTVWPRPNGLPTAIDPVAGLHLARVPELRLDERNGRLVLELDERAVAQLVAAHEFGLVLLVGQALAKRPRIRSRLRPRGCW